MTLFSIAWVVVGRVRIEVRRRALRTFAMLPPLGFAALASGSMVQYVLYQSHWGWAFGSVLWSILAVLNAMWTIRKVRAHRSTVSFSAPPYTTLGIVAITSILGAVKVFSPQSAFAVDVQLLIELFFLSVGLQFLSIVSLAEHDTAPTSRAARAIAFVNGLIAFVLSLAFLYYLGQPPPVT